MPIDPIVLQRRLHEAGRLRLGASEEVSREDGSTYTRPKKLATFRFTSRSQAACDKVAGHFGGTVEPWVDDRHSEWQVYTEAKSIEVIVPPPAYGFSQWLELWSGGGCERRCDGLREVLHDQACLCDPEDRECSPTTRLSVMLPDLESVGLWRIDTHGWNAAAELQGSVALAAEFSARGTYLPAHLWVDIRTERKPGKPVRKYAVPVLELDVAMRRLAAIAAATPDALALEAGSPLAPEAGVALPQPAYFEPVPPQPEAPGPEVAEAVSAVGAPTPERANAAQPIAPTGLKPRTAAQAGAPKPAEAPEEEHTPPSGEPAPPAPPSSEAPAPTLGASAAPTPSTGPRPAEGPVEGGAALPAPPSTPAPEDDDPFAAERTRQVAIWATQAGLDDEGRHHFLAAYSQGRYASAKLVPAEDVASIRAALIRVKRGELQLEEHEGRWRLTETQFGWESTDPGAQHRASGPPAQPEGGVGPVTAAAGAATPTGGPAEGQGTKPSPPSAEAPAQPAPAAGEVYSANEWKRRIEPVAGLGEVGLLKYARALAKERGTTPPGSLKEIPAELTGPVAAWVESQRVAG